MYKINKIWLDLDGVIADFGKKFKEVYGIKPPDTTLDKGKEEQNRFKDFVHEHYFAELDLMPDALMGINFLRRTKIPVEILSSTARPEFYDTLSTDKKIWLQRNGIEFPSTFVPDKRHKRNYVSENAILIDDTPVNIDQWRTDGGIGILHKDWYDTISILQMYIA
jgi:hypothetical protein